MKYINKFPTNADYQAFTEGGGYVTPNICYVDETNGIVMEPEIKEPLNMDIFEYDNITMLETTEGDLFLNLNENEIDKYKIQSDGIVVTEIRFEYGLGTRVYFYCPKEGIYNLNCVRISDNVIVDTIIINVID